MAPEIITLQLGNYANYVGAHFWNLQDEAIASTQLEDWSSVAASIDHEVLCSWSEDRHGVSRYSPRTVAVDLSGALGGVSFSLDVANTAATHVASSTWSGPVEVQQLHKRLKSKFRQKLEEAGQLDPDDEDALAAHQLAVEAAAVALHEQQQPKYWTDFLQVDLQPSAVLTLPGIWQGVTNWSGWGPAPDTSSSRDTAEAAVDKVRWWAEQCDKLQGLQIFADDIGGWGGFSHSIIQELREEYPSQPLLYFSLQQPEAQGQSTSASPGSSSNSSSRRHLSQSLGMSEITQLASLYVPLTPPVQRLGAAGASMFQHAALLATAIDTATLPLRCNGAYTAAGAAIGATDLHSLCHLLAGPAANLAAVSLQLPAGQVAGSSTLEHQTTSSSSALLTLMPSSGYLLTEGVQLGPEHCLAESLTLRGARGSTNSSLTSVSHAKQALDALLLQRQRDVTSVPCVSHACILPTPIALPLSFPRWLGMVPTAAMAVPGSPGSGTTSLNPRIPRPGQAAAPAPSALSRLTATSSFEGVLKSMQHSVQQLGTSAAGKACLKEWDYDAGDVDELQERLVQLAGKYSRQDEL